MSRRRLAFVVPRYGPEILGGAETFVREMAQHVAAAGLAEVEVFTTCATDHLTWRNELPAGTTHQAGLTLHRFPIQRHSQDLARYGELSVRIAHHHYLSVSEQLDWAANNAHAPALYAALAGRAGQFDLLFFAPYLAGLTLYGSAIAPQRSVLWPCLHDEAFAYLDVIRDLFASCCGLLFNTQPELQLAQRLYGPLHQASAHVIGIGFDEPAPAQPNRFRQKYGLTDRFILYAGRLEPAKNVELLINYFCRYCAQWQNRPPFQLVLMGSGPAAVPKHPHIVTVGHQPTHQKADAFAAASLLCQPSTNESFSIVLMEAWQRQTPVLVNQFCEVTQHHALASNGGLLFASYDEFEAALNMLAQDDVLRQALGRAGQHYVRTQFSWPATLARFEEALRVWTRNNQP